MTFSECVIVSMGDCIHAKSEIKSEMTHNSLHSKKQVKLRYLYFCPFFSGGYIFLATRPELTESNGRHSQLEPLMDKLETDGKWRRVSREVFPGLRLGKDGVMWCYTVL